MTEDNKQEGKTETAEEPLYDVLIPPGVPQKLLMDIIKKFNVKVVERKQKLYFANMEGDERELLAFRGTREVAEQVQQYMMSELRRFIGENEEKK
jgi:hypothetical protein